jgi:hypothetical protein
VKKCTAINALEKPSWNSVRNFLAWAGGLIKALLAQTRKEERNYWLHALVPRVKKKEV